jgi:hypothetical protein
MFDSYTRTAPATEVRTLPRQHAPAEIFHGRSSFESGVTRLIGSGTFPAAECAVLQVGLSGQPQADPAAGRKLLSLVANILRARVKSGALAYLGDSRFAVLLQGVSGRDAVAYCREVLSVLDGIRLQWQGEVLTVESWIGGVMVETHHDGLTLLEEAEHAAHAAQHKLGRKLHMVHEHLDSAISVQEEEGDPLDHIHTQTRGQATNAGLAAR